MKKTTLITTLLLAIIAFTSCQKDGIYDPKGKIDKIYYEENSEKYLSEDWTWDKNVLKTVDYYDSDGTIENTDIFTYGAKDRLLQVDNYEERASMKYNYDTKNRLCKAAYSEAGILLATYIFEYDDNELSNINITLNGYTDFNTRSIANPLKYILPEQSAQSINKALKENPLRGDLTVKIYLDWEKNNITEMEITYSGYSEEYTFEYDDKSNPFYGYLGLDMEDGAFERGNFASKNNITRITYAMSYNGISFSESDIVTYTYDGKLPITRSHEDVTEYFEYE